MALSANRFERHRRWFVVWAWGFATLCFARAFFDTYDVGGDPWIRQAGRGSAEVVVLVIVGFLAPLAPWADRIKIGPSGVELSFPRELADEATRAALRTDRELSRLALRVVTGPVSIAAQETTDDLDRLAGRSAEGDADPSLPR